MTARPARRQTATEPAAILAVEADPCNARGERPLVTERAAGRDRYRSGLDTPVRPALTASTTDDEGRQRSER